MADVLTDDFESGALAQWTTGGTAPTIESTIKNVGAYSVKFTFSGSASSYLSITSLPTRKAETYSRFYLYLTANPNTNMGVLTWNDSSGNTHDIVINSAGKMVFRRSSTAIATCTNAIPLNTWILVQVRHKKSSTAAVHEIICNGETVTDTSNDASTNNSMVYRIGHSIGGVTSDTFYIDDLVVSDSAYPGGLSSPITADALITLGDFVVDALANNGIDSNGSSSIANVVADGVSNCVINAVGASAMSDQIADANGSAGISADGIAALNDQSIDGSSNALIGSDAISSLSEIIVSADVDNAIIAEAQSILDAVVASGQASVGTETIVVVISDLVLTGHPESVRAALIAGAGGLLTEANVAIRNGGLSDDLEYARINGAKFVVRSVSGLGSSIETALEYYRDYGIQLFMPAGSNSPGETFESNGGLNLPSIIVTGAGDVNNETGDDIEFFAPDTVTIEPDLSSFSNGFIAGQIYAIKTSLDCEWWEARYRARMTASEGGVWDEVDGFGLIDVDAAVLFSGEIPNDPFAAIVRTVTAMLELSDFIVSGSVVKNILFGAMRIFNAKKRVMVFEGDERVPFVTGEKRNYAVSGKERQYSFSADVL